MMEDQIGLASLFPRVTGSPEETLDFGAACVAFLPEGSVVALVGSLGAGKTQFVKGLAQGLNVNPESVSSPTFSIVQEYQGIRPLVHMDLYRIESESELYGIGFDEYIESDAIVVVEWPQIARSFFPDETITISVSDSGQLKRQFELLPLRSASGGGGDVNESATKTSNNPS
jgi:tRNA threonylcarbamoyladenosine biosynthesis protein TsaE